MLWLSSFDLTILCPEHECSALVEALTGTPWDGRSPVEVMDGPVLGRSYRLQIVMSGPGRDLPREIARFTISLDTTGPETVASARVLVVRPLNRVAPAVLEEYIDLLVSLRSRFWARPGLWIEREMDAAIAEASKLFPDDGLRLRHYTELLLNRGRRNYDVMVEILENAIGFARAEIADLLLRHAGTGGSSFLHSHIERIMRSVRAIAESYSTEDLLATDPALALARSWWLLVASLLFEDREAATEHAQRCQRALTTTADLDIDESLVYVSYKCLSTDIFRTSLSFCTTLATVFSSIDDKNSLVIDRLLSLIRPPDSRGAYHFILRADRFGRGLGRIHPAARVFLMKDAEPRRLLAQSLGERFVGLTQYADAIVAEMLKGDYYPTGPKKFEMVRGNEHLLREYDVVCLVLYRIIQGWHVPSEVRAAEVDAVGDLLFERLDRWRTASQYAEILGLLHLLGLWSINDHRVKIEVLIYALAASLPVVNTEGFSEEIQWIRESILHTVQYQLTEAGYEPERIAAMVQGL